MPDWLITYLGSLQGGIVRSLAAELRVGSFGTAWLAFGLGAVHALTFPASAAPCALFDLGFTLPGVAIADDAWVHRVEHSIEVLLPFVQKVCPAARFVRSLFGGEETRKPAQTEAQPEVQPAGKPPPRPQPAPSAESRWRSDRRRGPP